MNGTVTSLGPTRWIAGNGRLSGIDGLRAVSAFAVAAMNFRIWFGRDYQVGPSSIAIDLFFFHSGMVLARAYGSGIISGTFSFKDFLWRRFLRLYPLYFAIFALCCLLEVREAGGIPSGTLWSWFLQLTWLNNSGLHPEGVWNFPMWSLSVEWLLSILFFGVVRSLKGRSNVGWAVLGLAAAALLFPLALHRGHDSWREFHWANWGFLSLGLVRGVFDFSVGILACSALEKWPRPSLRVLNGMGIASVAYLAAMQWLWDLPIATGCELLAVVVVLPVLSASCVASGTVLNRFLNLKPLVLLGDMSYAIYLIHLPLGKLVGEVLEGRLPAPVMGLVFFAVLTAIAYVLYRWVDVPARKFSMRVTTPAAVAAAHPPKKAA